ncbi:hypothetical protein ACEQPO_24835 [Bacillus sp. SL00103]
MLVTAEYYHLFVIEVPVFVQKELFQKAGLNVLFVEDISPYRIRYGFKRCSYSDGANRLLMRDRNCKSSCG